MTSPSAPPAPSSPPSTSSSQPTVPPTKLSFSFGPSTSRKPPLLSSTSLLTSDPLLQPSSTTSSLRLHDDSTSFSAVAALANPTPHLYIIPLKPSPSWRERTQEAREEKQRTAAALADTSLTQPPSTSPADPTAATPLAASDLPAELFSTRTIPLPPADPSLPSPSHIPTPTTTPLLTPLPSPSLPTPSDDVPSYSVPIAEYGVAMLRGMGWRGPGDAVGGAVKADVQPVVYGRRDDRAGLGAKREERVGGKGGSLPHLEKREGVEQGRGVGKAGERERGREQSAAAALKAKAGSRVLPLHSQQLRVGSLVRVLAGEHRRAYGRVKGMTERRSQSTGEGGERVYRCDVQLNGEEGTVEVDSRDLDLLDEHALPRDHPAFGRPPVTAKVEERKEKEDEEAERRAKRQKREGEDEGHQHRSRTERPARDSDERGRQSSASPSSSRVQWCRAHLRVRLVSRSYARGAHYRAKGVVTDVADASHIAVRLDGDGRVVDGLREDQLETVIPPLHGHVMVLRGEHRGEVGELLAKDGGRQLVTVQLEAELAVVQLPFDDVCEQHAAATR